MQAELVLWVAVLEAAINDLGRYPPGHKDRPEWWFNSNNKEVGSYLWICEAIEKSTTDMQRIIDNHLRG